MDMDGQYENSWWRYETTPKVEESLPFASQLPLLDDYSPIESGPCSLLSYQYGLAVQESVLDAIPLMMESFPYDDPLCSPFYHIPNPTITQQEDFLCGYGNGYGFCDNEMDGWSHDEKQPLLLSANNNEDGGRVREERVMGQDEEGTGKGMRRKRKRCEEAKKSSNSSVNFVGGGSSKMLSRKTISEHFYMPITQAAKELDVGLTLLKKRCRELGIRRWPHRKLMSLQALIKNVQELGEASEERLRDAIGLLEQERKLLEEMPDIKLEDNTKRLRQACFKANYKKRKLIGASKNFMDNPIATASEEEDDDVEIKSLLSDSFSSTTSSLL